MYYITNQSQEVLAVETTLLQKLNVATLAEFYQKMALDEICFEKEEERLTLHFQNNTESHTIKTSTLSTFLGEVTLVELIQTVEIEETTPTLQETQTALVEPEPISLADHTNDTTLDTILQEAKEEEAKGEEVSLSLDEETSKEPKEEVSLSLDENEDDLLQTILEEAKEEEPLLLDEEEKEPKEEVSLSLDDENEDDLLLQTILEEAKEEEPLLLDEETPKEPKEEVTLSLDDAKEEDEPLEITPIYIDAEHISQEIGISTEEYNEFLNEYIDTVLESDEALNGDDENAKQKAIQNLSHLSTILHLPILTELMKTIKQSSGNAQTKAIEKLYHTLNRFTTTPQEAQKATKEADLQEEVTPNVVEEAPQKENVQEKETIDNDLLDLGLGDVTANVESLTQEEDVLVEKNDGIELDLDALTLPVEEEPQPQQKSQDDAITLDLDALTTPLVEEEKVEEKAPQSDAFDLGLDLSEETNTPVTPAVEEVEAEVIEEEAPASEGFGTINLDDVKPIHFDFQIEEAANDLSLPTELIEEFVQDFIEQGHEETQKMLKAYEAGDLETIQKIGHLLKGTSSNLRITPLADTLYEIQFCEDSSQLEGLIKNYWAHFISFETQIKLLSNS